MSDYYNARRTNGLFDPKSKTPFKLSRSKIDLFVECPQCFYLDRRLGVGRPPGFPFTLNSAVDTLLKKEFDLLRKNGIPHPLFEEFGIEAIPFSCNKLDDYRNTFIGVQYLHEPSNFLVFGGVDDLWINPNSEIIIVDYKATAKQGEVNLDAEWQKGYKRQMEVYQWLVRNNGYEVSNTGYFVYCNGDVGRDKFDAKLDFNIKIIPYTGDTSWIEPKLMEIKDCLTKDEIPEMSPDCDYCNYRKEAVIAKIKFDKKYKK
ncbi:MAG: PD-(D/E)XK nuclease family protein [Candidatus Pacebacteria bacterium]|nr:PD-(D/E)XK nuclease family protein [Candidatus Paceibacterota bacterium]